MLVRLQLMLDIGRVLDVDRSEVEIGDVFADALFGAMFVDDNLGPKDSSESP